MITIFSLEQGIIRFTPIGVAYDVFKNGVKSDKVFNFRDLDIKPGDFVLLNGKSEFVRNYTGLVIHVDDYQLTHVINRIVTS